MFTPSRGQLNNFTLFIISCVGAHRRGNHLRYVENLERDMLSMSTRRCDTHDKPQQFGLKQDYAVTDKLISTTIKSHVRSI